MSIQEILLTLFVALIGSAAATFGFLEFMIKRKDAKEEKDVNKIVAVAVEKAKEEMHKELEAGLLQRGEEGRERFEINSKQIQKNAETAEKILKIQENQTTKVDLMMESLTALNATTRACAEGVKSTLYDKLYIIAQKAIARKGITADERTNVGQLWKSYKELEGNGKGEVYANICLNELEILTDEEARKRDLEEKGV